MYIQIKSCILKMSNLKSTKTVKGIQKDALKCAMALSTIFFFNLTYLNT